MFVVFSRYLKNNQLYRLSFKVFRERYNPKISECPSLNILNGSITNIHLSRSPTKLRRDSQHNILSFIFPVFKKSA